MSLTTLPAALHLTALSTYALSLSYTNISHLRTYEQRAEKAAEWSNTAAQRLHKTRSTQTTGTLTVTLSALSAISLIVIPQPTLRPLVAVLNTGTTLAAGTHMRNFWNEANQARVPFVQKFNEAVKGSEEVVRILGALSLGWAVVGGVWFLDLGALWGNVVYLGVVAGWAFVRGGLW